MTISGKLFRLGDSVELELRLNEAGILDLHSALQRALNCWDPAQRPKDMLDLSDKLEVTIIDEELKPQA